MSTSQRTGEIGSWFFTVENLPSRFTWQDLKDTIRCEASHGVWTDTWRGQGMIRVKRGDEARNLFRYLTSTQVRGRRLLVHIYHSADGIDPRYVNCNCNCGNDPSAPCPRQQNRTSTVLDALDVGPPSRAVESAPSNTFTRQSIHAAHGTTIPRDVNAQSPRNRPLKDAGVSPSSVSFPTSFRPTPASVPSATPACPTPTVDASRLELVPQHLLQQPVPTTQQVSQPAVLHAVSSSELPVNTIHGSFPTENSGVFVSNLNYKATVRSIEAFFSRAGRVTKCERRNNSATGEFRGHASIVYASTDAAARAIEMFHGKPFQGMLLSVRPDVTTQRHNPGGMAVSGRAVEEREEPVIVDGSRAHVYR